MMCDGWNGGSEMCGAMMGKMGWGPRGMAAPRLPPGNEEIEFQVHAEKAQKVGEIALEHAARVKENP